MRQWLIRIPLISAILWTISPAAAWATTVEVSKINQTVTVAGTITASGTVAVSSIAAGDNNIGNVDIVTLPALVAGTANIGDVDVLTIAAGNNNIGDVDVASIAAGDNNIGNVDIVTLPATPAGNNNIGDVDVASIAAGDNNIGNVDVVTLPATPTGTNNIGNVDVERAPAAGVVDTQSAAVTADATLEAATANLRLLGFTIRESAGVAAVATVLLRHGVESGGNCTGNVIAYIELSLNGADKAWYGDRGVAVASGVCVDVLAGEVDVNIVTVTEAAP